MRQHIGELIKLYREHKERAKDCFCVVFAWGALAGLVYMLLMIGYKAMGN